MALSRLVVSSCCCSNIVLLHQHCVAVSTLCCCLIAGSHMLIGPFCRSLASLYMITSPGDPSGSNHRLSLLMDGFWWAWQNHLNGKTIANSILFPFLIDTFMRQEDLVNQNIRRHSWKITIILKNPILSNLTVKSVVLGAGGDAVSSEKL